MKRATHIVAVLALLGISRAGAQPAGVYVDIAPCLTLASDAERQACYVTRAEELRATLATGTSAPAQPLARQERVPAEPVAAVAREPAPSPVESFGRELPGAVALRETNARILATEEGTEELVATIAELDERMPNMWDVTLSNGQLWRQVNSEKYRLREGAEIRIYPSPFSGSFRLSAEGVNGFIQVRRVR